MSLDNVLAVAGAAQGIFVLVVGLMLSVVLMGLAANLIAGLLQRHRWIAWIGLLIVLYVAVMMIWTARSRSPEPSPLIPIADCDQSRDLDRAQAARLPGSNQHRRRPEFVPPVPHIFKSTRIALQSGRPPRLLSPAASFSSGRCPDRSSTTRTHGS